MTTAGLYIHIPFCEKRCKYCDFFSCTDTDRMDEYVRELCHEITMCGNKFPVTISTIYLGGGTPGLLSLQHLDDIFNTIHRSFSVRSLETTIEINPNSSSLLKEYPSFGIDRLSIGVQTLHDGLLKRIGRLHTAKEALTALQKAKEYFVNISADLILGLSKEQDIEDDVKKIAPYCTHISGYMLTIPPKSPLKQMIKEKKFSPLSDDETADQYELMTNTCRELGFYRYETSNYAKLGCESKHNASYWNMSQYIGVGPSAHSYMNGIRYYNVDDLSEYLSGKHSGNGLEKIERGYSVSADMQETIMLSLRTTNGLDLSAFNKKYSVDFLSEFQEGIKAIEKYVSIKNNRLSILPKYFSVQNSIILSLLTE